MLPSARRPAASAAPDSPTRSASHATRPDVSVTALVMCDGSNLVRSRHQTEIRPPFRADIASK